MATNFDLNLGNSQDNFNVDLNNQVEGFVVEFGETTWVTNNDFNKLENRPYYAGELMTGDTEIPEVQDATLTIQKNGSDVGTFSANQSEDTTINITVPVATSELTNDANFQNANDLSNAISAHNQSTSAHQDIRQSITDEQTARVNADNSLQGQIDAITSASDVVDIVGTYAKLQAYDTQHLQDNDVIKVLQDETHNEAMTYYRWNKSAGTWTYIGAEGPYYTKSETNNLLDAKLDADEVPDGFFDGPATITPADGTTVEVYGGLKLKAINLKGDTTQQTYSGKNFVNTPDDTRSSGGLDIVWSDNICTFSGTASSTSAILTSSTTLDQNLPQGTYTFSIQEATTYGITLSVLNADTSGYVNYNIPAGSTSVSININYNTVSYRIVANGWSNGDSVSGILKQPMFEASSTPTNYEPYVGGKASPNPDYPQNVNVVTGEQTVRIGGKNLWKPAPDGTSTQGGITLVRKNGVITLTGTSTSTSAGTSAFYDLDAPLPAGTYTYSIPNPLPYRFEFVMQDSDGNNHFPVLPVGSTSDTITTTWETVKIRNGISGYRVGTEINLTIEELQLEEGSTATTYQPYQSQSYTVDLGSIELCKIGDYQDYIYKSGGDWYIHKETVSVSLNGSTGWSTAYTGTSNYYYRYRYLNGSAYDGTNTNWFANNGTPAQVGASTTVNGIFLANNGEIRVRYGAEETIDTWKAHLANSPMIFYYQLATPTDTKITDSTLIGQLNAVLNATLYQPTTTISSSGNLPAILGITAYTEHLNSLLEIAAEPIPEPVTYSDFVGTDGVNAGTAGLVPAPATTDNDKYLKSDGTWAAVSGGGSVTPVQTTGTSQTDVMSQNAVSSMVFSDPGTDTKIEIGSGASANGLLSVAIGGAATANRNSGVALGYNSGASLHGIGIGEGAKGGTVLAHDAAIGIGYNAESLAKGSMALGAYSSTSSQGEVNIGTSSTSYGYSNSNYRLISGVYDGQNAHDVATVGQVNATIDAINTALGTSIPHIGAST